MAVRKVRSRHSLLLPSLGLLISLSLQAHNLGRKHKSAVRDYYAQFEENVVQAIIDTRVREFEAREAAIRAGLLPSNAPFSSVMPPHPLAPGVPPSLPPGWESGTPPPMPMLAQPPPFLSFPGLPPLPGMMPGLPPPPGMPMGLPPPPPGMENFKPPPGMPPLVPGMPLPPFPGVGLPPPPGGFPFPPPHMQQHH